MNIGVYFRIRNRFSTFFQGFVYPFFFVKFGRGSRLLRPRRLEGSHRIAIGRGVFVNNDGWLETIFAFGKEPVIEIGNGTYIGNSVHIVSTQSIVIGEEVLIADRVYIADYVHGYQNVSSPIIRQPLEKKGEVKIGDGAWLGEGVSVIGASVGRNCIVGANSVVTKDVPDYSVAVGVPAKVIKKYSHETKEWISCD